VIRRSHLLLSVLGILVLAPPAAAALPAGSKVIVPGKSIGGVKIGMPAEDALKIWGRGGSCDEGIRGTCRYADSFEAALQFDVVDGKVSLIAIRVATDDRGTPRFKGTILRWKTAKGIRIGSSQRSLVKAYPKVKGSPSGVALVASGRRTTFASSGGRVSEIVIERNP